MTATLDQQATAIINKVLREANEQHVTTLKDGDRLTQATIDLFKNLSPEEKGTFVAINLHHASVGEDNSRAPSFTPDVGAVEKALRSK